MLLQRRNVWVSKKAENAALGFRDSQPPSQSPPIMPVALPIEPVRALFAAEYTASRHPLSVVLYSYTHHLYSHLPVLPHPCLFETASPSVGLAGLEHSTQTKIANRSAASASRVPRHTQLSIFIHSPLSSLAPSHPSICLSPIQSFACLSDRPSPADPVCPHSRLHSLGTYPFCHPLTPYPFHPASSMSQPSLISQ